MILYTLIALTQSDSASVVRRFEQFMANAKTLSVSVSVSLGGTPVGNAKLQMEKPDKLSVSVVGVGVSSSFAANEKGGLELEKTSQSYDTYPAMSKFYAPPSRMSSVIHESVPRFLLDGNFKNFFPGSANISVKSKQPVGGAVADLLESSGQMQGAKYSMKVWVDTSGKVLKSYSRVESMEGVRQTEYALTNYVVNKPIPAQTFTTKIPLGYSPYALEAANTAIESGQSFPLGNYASASGGSKSLRTLLNGKNGLVLFVDPEFHSNPAVLKSVQALTGKVPNSRLVVISTAKDAAAARNLGGADALYDPKGSELAKINLAGAPMLYLLDKHGKVVLAFLGFDGKWEGMDEAIAKLSS